MRARAPSRKRGGCNGDAQAEKASSRGGEGDGVGDRHGLVDLAGIGGDYLPGIGGEGGGGEDLVGEVGAGAAKGEGKVGGLWAET